MEFHSFPALIKATRERDAARKAKQQEAQLPAQSADASPHAAAASDTPEHASECPAHEHMDKQRAGLQAAHETSAERQDVKGDLPNGSHTKGEHVQYPAGPQISANGAEHHAEAPLLQPSRLSNSSVAKQRSDLQDPAQRPNPSSAGSLEAGTHTQRQGVPAGQAQHNGRVVDTVDDLSDKLSEDDLHIDLDDQLAQPVSHHMQDQRVLQQLQLLNKAAFTQVRPNLPLSKDAAATHAHRNSGLSSTTGLVHTGHSDGLDALDCIVQDTDSDIEGRVA